jgi:hypothetical protein
MMTGKKEFAERRGHKRFKVKNGAIAIISPSNALATPQKHCQILNISKGGLALRYIIINGESNEPVELNVLFIQDICFTFLKNLPFKSVWISHTASKTSFSKLRIEQQGVEFGEMMPNQIAQLDRFLEKCTIR